MMRPPQEHELKCWPEFFAVILSGEKTFELRRDDRGFRVGDVLWLREWRRERIIDGKAEGVYTGRELRRPISYILSGWGLEHGFVCLGIPSTSTAAPDLGPLRAAVQALDALRPPAPFDAVYRELCEQAVIQAARDLVKER